MDTLLIILGIGLVIYIIYKNVINTKPKKTRNKNSNSNQSLEDIFTDDEIRKYFQSETEKYNIISDENTPQIIIKFRQFYQDKTFSELQEMYFDFLQKILNSEKKGDLKNIIFFCQGSMGLIEPLIIYEKKKFGMFELKKIPSIEYGLIYNSILGNKGQLENIKDIVYYFPELHFLKPEVEKSFIRKDLSSQIYHYVKSNPNCIQSELKNKLNYNDGKLISNTIFYMEKVGKITKTKIGDKVHLQIK